MTNADRCERCGHPVDLHDRHVRFVKPDPVVDAGEIPTSDIWMTDADANASVMMQVNNVGAFVRALLPVHLTAGHTVTYGIWIAIDPRELRRVFDTWWSAQYADLVVDGLVANAIEPWGLLGTPVRLAVLDPDLTPYCVGSLDDRLRSVLTDEWDHEIVLSALP